MSNKNTFRDFTNCSIAEAETDAVKGGRSNNSIPINTGSFGFINWDDIDVRSSGLISLPSQNAEPFGTFKKGG
ncbi:MAG TPA: hypothetical protein ENJ53_01620 [Phaeodactylibacter sp.]|nr:hypothetical protein [Phaeodactylibacter sp.]